MNLSSGFGLNLVMGPLLMVLLVLPILVYVVARFRDSKEDTNDTQLGIKVVFSWFQTMSYQVLFLAAAILVYSVLEGEPSELRLSVGLAVPSAVIASLLYFASLKTNAASRPSIRRMVHGIGLVFTSGIAFVALMVGGVMLFQKGEGSGEGTVVASAALVYGIAAIAQGLRFIREVNAPEA